MGRNKTSLTNYYKGARAEGFSCIIESFTGVRARILWEHLSNHQSSRVSTCFVLEVLAGLDLLVIVKPYYVEFISSYKHGPRLIAVIHDQIVAIRAD